MINYINKNYGTNINMDDNGLWYEQHPRLW
jgi:hypothetical protein